MTCSQDQEIPPAARVLETMEDADELTKEDRALIRELFKSLEIAHSRASISMQHPESIISKTEAQTTDVHVTGKYQTINTSQGDISLHQNRYPWQNKGTTWRNKKKEWISL